MQEDNLLEILQNYNADISKNKNMIQQYVKK